jgi:hypothetical protein
LKNSSQQEQNNKEQEFQGRINRRGVEKQEMQAGSRKCRKERYGQNAHARRDMVKQHKHGDGVKKQKQEEIWSSSTSMEMVSKSTSKKRYGQATQAWKRDMVKQHKHGDAVKN